MTPLPVTSAVVTRPHGAAPAAALPGSVPAPPGSPTADGPRTAPPCCSGAQGRARPWPGLRDGHSADTPSGGRATQPFCANPPGTPPGARQERRARDAPSARGLARRRTQPPPSPRTRPPPRSAPINPRAAPPAGGAGSACAFSAPERRAQARAPPGDRRGAWPRRRGAARGGRAHAGGGAHGAGPAPGRLVCAPRRAGGPGLRPSFSPRAARAAGPARSCAPLRGRRRAAAGRWAGGGGARSGGGPGGPGARLPQAARAGGAGRGAAGVRRGRRVVSGRWDSALLGRAVLGVHLPPQGVSVRMGRAFGWRTSHPNTHTQRSGCGGRYGGHPGVRSGRTYRPCPLEELRQTGDRWTRGGPPRR